MKLNIVSIFLFLCALSAHAHQGAPHTHFENNEFHCFKFTGNETVYCNEELKAKSRDVATKEDTPTTAADRPRDEEPQTERQRHRGVSQQSQECHYNLKQPRDVLANTTPTTPVLPATQLLINQQINRLNPQAQAGGCRAFEMAARINGETLLSEQESITTSDRKITCVKKAGYTLDYPSCESTAKLYNMVVTAEAALDLAQQVRTAQSTNKINQEVAQRAADGDTQNAAYDASIQHNKNLSNLNKEKAAAYMLAMGALGSKLASWQGNSAGSLQKLCSGLTPNPSLGGSSNLDPTLPVAKCQTLLPTIKGSREVFANDTAKSQFIMAFMDYMKKAALAGLTANNLSNIAKKVEQVKNGTEDAGPGMFERCAVAPNDPACGPTGTRTPGAEYTGSEFSIGDGIGNNAFGDPLTDTEIKLDDPNALPIGESVGDASSPFVDEAKEATGIMDPAAAANVQASGGAGSGAGGGGSGGGGGGSASLGSDLAGPDAGKKDADVKANKSEGNYNFAGGGGFQAIKPMKDDANPFASLFDSKSQGGLEEDRSIASDDIGGKDSGLFQRITRRYNKVTGDKRIEALDLE